MLVMCIPVGVSNCSRNMINHDEPVRNNVEMGLIKAYKTL
jgi:hypothetical protein